MSELNTSAFPTETPQVKQLAWHIPRESMQPTAFTKPGLLSQRSV
jgi:hypothetical protein